jgi:sulfatase maturation enzyme AslB (radical SAM superfamily)
MVQTTEQKLQQPVATSGCNNGIQWARASKTEQLLFHPWRGMLIFLSHRFQSGYGANGASERQPEPQFVHRREEDITRVAMHTSQIFQAWGKILSGNQPSLSIEITRECPLRCPGCYAFDAAHLGGGKTLRDLNDRKGQALIDGVLEVVERRKPLHLSIVGGDPLVRYRELETLVPQLLTRGIHVQIVTSAFRKIQPDWAHLERLHVVVSIDGLQPEHDVRRAPATYERILKNIAGQRVTVHCTVTAQMMKRPGYLAEFLEFWTPRPEIKKVWFSLFTPQVGDKLPEILSPAERAQAIAEMMELRKRFPKLDMPAAVIQQFAAPPHSPEDCVFALTTQTLSADLQTKITPCQFGGKPDCASCGCIASMGLAAVAAHKLGGFVPVGAIFKASIKIGQVRAQLRDQLSGRSRDGQGREIHPAGASDGADAREADAGSSAQKMGPVASGGSLPIFQTKPEVDAERETELTH